MTMSFNQRVPVRESLKTFVLTTPSAQPRRMLHNVQMVPTWPTTAAPRATCSRIRATSPESHVRMRAMLDGAPAERARSRQHTCYMASASGRSSEPIRPEHGGPPCGGDHPPAPRPGVRRGQRRGWESRIWASRHPELQGLRNVDDLERARGATDFFETIAYAS